MKKLFAITLALGFILAISNLGWAQCNTIKDGLIFDIGGNQINTGFDKWGYNYQAHMFNGLYCDAYRDAAWCQEWKDVRLMMKWNDAWLSNKDCDDDGLLDRHDGYASYIGSGAWCTNHQSGSYIDADGKWYTADGTEIGPVIWGDFAVIQRVYNDPCEGAHGIEYLSPAGPGFGKW